MATFEQWKADWNTAFTPEALSSALTMQFHEMNRTFVRVQMLSKDMIKTWFDLLRRNHPRLITESQMSTVVQGPCTLFMCYLTTNHVDFRDPTAISSVAPMYVNEPYICIQGLMQLNKTMVGTMNSNEAISLLLMSAKTVPRGEKATFQYIFISPRPSIGKALRSVLEAKDVNFNRCVGGSLISVFPAHAKNKCSCLLSVSNWKEMGMVKDFQTQGRIVVLPTITFKGVKLGSINLPWATGHSYDLIKQGNWIVEDEGMAELAKSSLEYTDILRSHARATSFLAVLAGIDGIHIIDFVEFVKLDPLEVQRQHETPSGQVSASGP